jgi:hypothetical protein
MDTDAVQIVDGKWYVVAWGGEPFIEDCCDCALSHRMTYRLRNGKLEVRYVVDHKRTKSLRRKHGIKVTRSDTL